MTPGDGRAPANRIAEADLELLHDLLDGRTSPEQAELLRARLQSEPSLRAAWTQLVHLRDLLREAWDEDDSPHLDPRLVADRVLASVAADRELPLRPSSDAATIAPAARRRWLLLAVQFASAAAVCGAAGWFAMDAAFDLRDAAPPAAMRTEARGESVVALGTGRASEDELRKARGLDRERDFGRDAGDLFALDDETRRKKADRPTGEAHLEAGIEKAAPDYAEAPGAAAPPAAVPAEVLPALESARLSSGEPSAKPAGAEPVPSPSNKAWKSVEAVNPATDPKQVEALERDERGADAGADERRARWREFFGEGRLAWLRWRDQLGGAEVEQDRDRDSSGAFEEAKKAEASDREAGLAQKHDQERVEERRAYAAEGEPTAALESPPAQLAQSDVAMQREAQDASVLAFVAESLVAEVQLSLSTDLGAPAAGAERHRRGEAGADRAPNRSAESKSAASASPERATKGAYKAVEDTSIESRIWSTLAQSWSAKAPFARRADGSADGSVRAVTDSYGFLLSGNDFLKATELGFTGGGGGGPADALVLLRFEAPSDALPQVERALVLRGFQSVLFTSPPSPASSRELRLPEVEKSEGSNAPAGSSAPRFYAGWMVPDADLEAGEPRREVAAEEPQPEHFRFGAEVARDGIKPDLTLVVAEQKLRAAIQVAAQPAEERGGSFADAEVERAPVRAERALEEAHKRTGNGVPSAPAAPRGGASSEPAGPLGGRTAVPTEAEASKSKLPSTPGAPPQQPSPRVVRVLAILETKRGG